MFLKRLIILAVLAVSLSCVTADEIMFSGNTDGQWIARAYRLENADMFDIYHSSPDRPFEPMLQQVKGKLSSVQAVGKTLRVICNDKSSAIISENGEMLETRNLPGKPVSMCESPADPAGQNELTVLVSRTDCRGEAAAAGVQIKADEWLCLYNSYGQEFKPVASKAGLNETKLGVKKTTIVQAGGKVYVLLVGSTTAEILTWSAFDDWKRLATLKEKPLGILTIDGGVFLVYSRKVENNADIELRLAKLLPDGKISMPMPIVDPETKESLVWDADTKMALSSLGKEAGICWKDRTKWQFLTVNDAMQSGETKSIDDLLRASTRLQKVEEVQQYFTIAIMSAGFAVMFLLKPYITTPRLLILPPTLRPANLIKRVVALIADILIIQIPIGIAVNYFLISVRGIPRSQIMDMIKDDPQRLIETCPELLYFAMAFIVIFAIYGIAMEMLFGWTLGKKIFGLRVVTDDAINPPLREAALRNIFKIIALVSISPESGMMWYAVLVVIVTFMTRYRQRIGDLVARTIVVEAAAPADRQPPIVQE